MASTAPRDGDLLLPPPPFSAPPPPSPARSIFLYMFLGVVILSVVFLAFRGKQVWKRRNPMDAYAID